MNAKFFDLKPEKQDRMINAALKIFALNGYTHASTDDIVKEAHISKGLLFHYFESKLGVYAFLYDYSARYMALELSGAVDPSEHSYMTIRKQMEAAKLQTLKKYPYMQMFLNVCEKESNTDALEAVKEGRLAYENAVGTVLARADYETLKLNPDSEKIIKMMDCIIDSIMEEALRKGNSDAEVLYKESVEYISLIERKFI